MNFITRGNRWVSKDKNQTVRYYINWNQIENCPQCLVWEFPNLHTSAKMSNSKKHEIKMNFLTMKPYFVKVEEADEYGVCSFELLYYVYCNLTELDKHEIERMVSNLVCAKFPKYEYEIDINPIN